MTPVEARERLQDLKRAHEETLQKLAAALAAGDRPGVRLWNRERYLLKQNIETLQKALEGDE